MVLILGILMTGMSAVAGTVLCPPPGRPVLPSGPTPRPDSGALTERLEGPCGSSDARR